MKPTAKPATLALLASLALPLALALAFALPLSTHAAGDALETSLETSLETGFDNPPVTARPLGWWHWANGNVTTDGISADLESIKRAGMGGVQMFDVEIYMPPGPVRYGSDSWLAHMEHAIRKASELGLEFHMMNTPGWSASGGPWVTEAKSMKRIVWTETNVGGGSVKTTLPRPDSKPFYAARTTSKGEFYQDIVVLAVPVTKERIAGDLNRKIGFLEKPVVRSTGNRPGIPAASVINLSAHMDAAGNLDATLPPGEWTLLRFGFVSTGKANHPAVSEGHGLEIDKLDADAVAFQFERAILPVIRKAGPLAGKTFNGLLFDSFEGGFQNWTARFPEEFMRLKNYDIIPWLPLITGRIVESEAASEAVLWDFRHVIEELIAENYYGVMHRLAARHGLKIYSESQGGPINPMSANRHVDVPMNEFWMPEVSVRGSRIKQSVSAASFAGKRVVAAESYTATPEHGRFQNTPATLKRPGDQAFAYGLNRFAFHSQTHQPVTDAAPGFSLGRYGVHFGRLNTWWPYADAWIAYLSRSQYLLQQGHIAADICLLVDEDLGYGLPAIAATLAPGHDMQVCYPPDLQKMSVCDGVLSHPEAGDFRLLLTSDKRIAKTWVATLPTLRRLHELVSNGAVLAGDPPVAPAGLADVKNKAEFDRLVGELWGGLDRKKNISKKTGAGVVYSSTRKPAQILGEIKVAKDVSWTPSGVKVVFIHRATSGADIYFISSQSAEPAALELEFRQPGRAPELWDADTGVRADATIFRKTENGIALPVAFEPWGSVFVVFRKPLPARWATATEPATVAATQTAAGLLSKTYPTAIYNSDGTITKFDQPQPPPALQTLAAPWRVRFPDGRGAPAGELVFDKLASLSMHANPGVKYYSGTTIYRTTFAAAAPHPWQIAGLDLGDVADIARVFINGNDAGVAWKPPFRRDITRWLRDGENTLEIHVANRWINRLIGDEAIDDGLEYQDTGGKSKFTDGRIQKFPDWLYDSSKRPARKRHSFSVWKHYNADSPLVPSGLLGPVRLEWYNHIKIP